MDVAEALVHVRERLAELQHRHAVAREQYIQLGVEIADAEAEEKVLRRIAERYELPIAGQEPPLPQEVEEWQGLDRTTAIERTLQEVRIPMSPKQIANAMRDKGREGDDYHAVSAALAHLKRQGRASQAERGRWVSQVSAADEPQVRVAEVAVPDYAESVPADMDLAPQPELGAT
jgi:hypothetical protein